MTLQEILKISEIRDMVTLGGVLFLLLTSIIQIAPIKINPWDRIFKWVGQKINGEVREDLKGIRTDLDAHIVSEVRTNILRFANQCRKKTIHDLEEWAHVLDDCKWYENYIEEHTMQNGVIELNIEYLRELYKEISKEGKL